MNTLQSFVRSGNYVDANGNVFFKKHVSTSVSPIQLPPVPQECLPYACNALDSRIAAEFGDATYGRVWEDLGGTLIWPWSNLNVYDRNGVLVTDFNPLGDYRIVTAETLDSTWDICSSTVDQFIQITNGSVAEDGRIEDPNVFGNLEIGGVLTSRAPTDTQPSGAILEGVTDWEVETSSSQVFFPAESRGSVGISTQIGTGNYVIYSLVESVRNEVVIPNNYFENQFRPFRASVQFGHEVTDAGTFYQVDGVITATLQVGDYIVTNTQNDGLSAVAKPDTVAEVRQIAPAIARNKFFAAFEGRLTHLFQEGVTAEIYDRVKLDLARNYSTYTPPGYC